MGEHQGGGGGAGAHDRERAREAGEAGEAGDGNAWAGGLGVLSHVHAGFPFIFALVMVNCVFVLPASGVLLIQVAAILLL